MHQSQQSSGDQQLPNIERVVTSATRPTFVMQYSISWIIVLSFYLSSLVEIHASAPLNFGWTHKAPYSRGATGSRASHSRRRRFPHTYYSSDRDPSAVVLAARKTKVEAVAEPQVPEVSFDDLGPVGKVVAGVTQVGTTILFEYCTGFLLGYLGGTVIGTPGLIFRQVEPGVPKMLMAELKGRFGRMNTRSMRFGRSLGGVSATFKGTDVTVRLLRYGREDSWNEVLSSAAAGAIFARKGKWLIAL